jgi:hypothetical protein
MTRKWTYEPSYRTVRTFRPRLLRWLLRRKIAIMFGEEW